MIDLEDGNHMVSSLSVAANLSRMNKSMWSSHSILIMSGQKKWSAFSAIIFSTLLKFNPLCSEAVCDTVGSSCLFFTGLIKKAGNTTPVSAIEACETRNWISCEGQKHACWETPQLFARRIKCYCVMYKTTSTRRMVFDHLQKKKRGLVSVCINQWVTPRLQKIKFLCDSKCFHKLCILGCYDMRKKTLWWNKDHVQDHLK